MKDIQSVKPVNTGLGLGSIDAPIKDPALCSLMIGVVVMKNSRRKRGGNDPHENLRILRDCVCMLISMCRCGVCYSYGGEGVDDHRFI